MKKNLADLTDKYKFSGTYTGWNSNRTSYKGEWEIEITWEKLFALFSPHLLDYPSDPTAKQIISTALYQSKEKKLIPIPQL